MKSLSFLRGKERFSFFTSQMKPFELNMENKERCPETSILLGNNNNLLCKPVWRSVGRAVEIEDGRRGSGYQSKLGLQLIVPG